AAGAEADGSIFALLAFAILGDLASTGFALDHRDAVARFRRAVEAEHLDRNRRSRFMDRDADIADQGADAAPFSAGHHDVADLQRAALDQHGCDRTTAAIELGLDHRTFGRPFGIGMQVEDFSL